MLDLTRCLKTRGHDVFVAVRPAAVWQEKLNFIAGERILRLPLTNAVDLQSAWQLANLIRQEKIEIVHAHPARDYALAALAVRLSRTNARLVLTRHLLFPIKKLYKLLLPRETVFIAVSRAVQEQLLKQKIVSPQHIKLIHNGIDTRYFASVRRSFNRTSFLERLRLSPSRRYVGLVGEIVPHKGQTDFVRAAAYLAERWRDVDFLIIGQDNSPDKKHQAALENLIDKLDLSSRVLLVGWSDDVAQMLCALDVFVSASRVEPFGLVMVEAMAAGLPVAATESEGAREILTDNETGKLVKIGDAEAMANAVSEILGDETLRQNLSKNAEKAAREKFDLSRMIAETEKVYAELLSNS